MQNLSFQMFAWISCIMFAGESLSAKFISKHKIQNPWLFNALWVFIVVVLNSIICFYNGVGVPKVWGNVLLSAVFFALSMTFYILMVGKFDVSVFVPMENLRTVFSLFLGIFFLGEALSLNQFWLIGLMLLASILVTLDEKFSIKTFFNKNIWFILIEVLSLSLMAMFLKRAAMNIDFWTLNFWYTFIGGLLILPTWPLFKKDFALLSKPQVGSVVFLSVFGVLANLAAARAYASNISISAAIISVPLSVIVVMILSTFLPKLLEHHSWKVYALRITAMIILIYAGIKLS